MDIEITDNTGIGYKALADNGRWIVALLNFCPDVEKIIKLERHMESDEAFCLLRGRASLFVGEEMKPYKMEPNRIYHVKKQVWHAIVLSRDAQVLVVENSDTTAANSEYNRFKEGIAVEL